METQKEKIRKILKEKRSVSNYELLMMFIPRYAARIHELNKEGMGIRFKHTPTEKKKRLGLYYLPDD